MTFKVKNGLQVGSITVVDTISNFQQTESVSTVPPSLVLDFSTKSLDSRITYNRSTTATYVGSNGIIQTAQVNVPRFEHDPLTRASKGILLEEDRTNLTPYSVYATGQWTFNNAEVGTSTKLAPDGTTITAFLANTTSGVHRVNRTFSGSYTNNDIYTLSFFVAKPSASDVRGLIARIRTAAGGQAVSITVSDAGANSGYTFYSSAPFGANPPAAVTSSDMTVTPYSNDWYRIAIRTAVSNIDTTFTQWDIGFSTAIATDMGNSTANTEAFIWGAQIERGYFATSYIPTTTASVTRAYDEAKITGAPFYNILNNNEATIVTEFQSLSSVGGVLVNVNRYPSLFTVLGTTSSTNVLWYGAAFAEIYVNNTYNTLAGATSTGSHKLAVAVANTGGTTVTCIDGATLASKSGVRLGRDLTGLGIGTSMNTTSVFNGTIKSLVVYPKQLSNTQILNLTSS